METDDAQRLRKLERENARLKRIVADKSAAPTSATPPSIGDCGRSAP